MRGDTGESDISGEIPFPLPSYSTLSDFPICLRDQAPGGGWAGTDRPAFPRPHEDHSQNVSGLPESLPTKSPQGCHVLILRKPLYLALGPVCPVAPHPFSKCLLHFLALAQDDRNVSIKGQMVNILDLVDPRGKIEDIRY